MIRTIAHKELLEQMRDGRFRLAALVVAVLLLVALGLGVAEYATVRAEAERAEEASWDQWVEQGEKNPHSAAHFAMYVYKPVSALSFADPGIHPYVGLALWLEAHYQNEFTFRPARDATAAGRLGQVTAANVLGLLVPLLIVLLAFGTFAAERDAGTLRQVLSLGVDPRTLAVGKAVGVGAALAALLVPAAGVGSLALVLASGSFVLGDALLRFGGIALAYGLYFTAFLGVALAVSAWARSSQRALVGLLAFWALTTLVLPRVATDLARTAYPIPSAEAFWQSVGRDLEEGIDGHDPADERVARLREETLARYGVTRIEDLPVNFSGIALQASEEYSNTVYDRHYSDLWATYERQNRFQTLAGVLSPLLAVRAASMGLAGTDFEAHRHFAEAAERYRRDFVEVMNDDLTMLTNPAYEKNVRGRAFWASAPRFAYTPPDAAWAFRNEALALALLALWAGLALAATALLARRASLTLTP